MRLFGLIGKPLKHSFSQAYFTKKFEAEKITDCRYQNFELGSIAELPALLAQMPQLEGLNVTIPYKKEVIPFLHSANEIVQHTGACNCIRIVDGKLLGHNTDVIGFRHSLQRQLEPHHRQALVLGTGGSSGAVCFALQSLGIAYRTVSRQPGKDTLSYEAITPDLLQQYTLIINTTPLGMFPDMDKAPELPYEALSSRHLLFDLIYNPETTLFLKKGAASGARTSNGYEMLLLQAEEGWKIWNA